MKAPGPVRLSALAKAAAAVSLLVCVVLVVWLVYRGLDKAEIPVRPGPSPVAPVVGPTAEKIKHLEFKSGRLTAEIEADVSTTGGNGLVLFEGGVKVRLYDGARSVTTSMSAGSLVYDRNNETFRASGGVEAVHGLVRISVPAGPAEAAVYHAAGNVVRVEGGFTAGMESPGSGNGIAVEGRGLDYRMGDGLAFISGPVVIAAGHLSIRAGSARLELAASEGTLESAGLSGGVRIEGGDEDTGVIGAAAGSDGSVPSVDQAGGFILRADRADVRFDGASGRAAAVSASGEVKLADQSGKGAALHLGCPACNVLLGERGEITLFTASGGVDATATASDGRVTRLTGGRLEYSGATGSLAVFGRAGMEDDELALEAPAIVAERGGGGAAAEGGVKGYLKPGADRFPSGLFHPDAAVYFSGGKAVVSREDKKLVLQDGFSLWQTAASLSGSSFEFDSGTGDLTASGGLKTSFTCGPGQADGAVVESARMTYSASFRKADWSGGTVMSAPGYKAFSRSASAVFPAGGKALGSLKAEADVRLVCRGYEGKCGLAVYEPGRGLLTLTGEPSLSGPEASDIRGDRLTLSIPDDKLFVERSGKGRSLILLKNGR